MWCVRYIKDGPHVQWIDNFTKNYNRKKPDLTVGSYSACLWTGIANRIYTGDTLIDLGVKYALDFSIVPVMPPTLDVFWEQLPVFTEQMAVIDREGMYYARRSFVDRFKVNNVPLSPHVDEKTNPTVHKMLAKKVDSIDKLVPERLMPDNIGSNLGLIKVMRSIITELMAARAKKYRVIMSDVAIFNPILKVIVL
jgi:hypothetical protein